MSGYTKLFNSILASTVWSEPNEVRIVWITMLAMANKDGVVEGSVPGLATFARLPVPATRFALDRLASPDEDSRSKEADGRRIEAVDGGWKLINHYKYRQMMSKDERREYLRVKKREQRARDKEAGQKPVNTRREKSTMSTHTAPDTYPYTDPAQAPGSQGTINKLDRKTDAHTTSGQNGASAARQMTPIIVRNPHLTHVACDPSLSYCVPAAVHHKLADLLAPKHAGDREAAKTALIAWYASVWTGLPGGTVMGDAFKFWQTHFDAAFVIAAPKKANRLTQDPDAQNAAVLALMKKRGDLA